MSLFDGKPERADGELCDDCPSPESHRHADRCTSCPFKPKPRPAGWRRDFFSSRLDMRKHHDD